MRSGRSLNDERVRQSRAQSEPRKKVKANVGHYEYAEPLREVNYQSGFNCVIPIRVGKTIFRMCVDTGGGRSMIRTSFRDQLAKHGGTAKFVKERYKISNDVRCGGICSDMESTVMQHVTKLSFSLDPVNPDGKAPPDPVSLELEFGELDNASDPLLLGFPDIVKLDVRFFQDDDDNVWVEFGKLGISVLAESPKQQNG